MQQTGKQVVILAGGLATRLRPVTETIPKALIPINDEPFINHQLRLLKKNQIEEVILCVGYLGEMIQIEIGNGNQFGLSIKYCFDGEKLLGTGGAIRNALSLLADNFFVLYGDSYLNCPYQKIFQYFLQNNKQGLMTVFKNEGQWDTSNVEFENQTILAYNKTNRTPKMRFIDYGLGIFNKKVFTSLPENTVIDLATIYQNLLAHNQLSAFEVEQRFYEVGSFAGIEELSYYLQQSKGSGLIIEQEQLLQNEIS